jgi:hypothetical protein
VSTAAGLGACISGARADFSFRLTFAADSKAGGVGRRDVKIVCVCVCTCENFGKTCGVMMRAEWGSKGVGQGGQKGKTVVPQELKRGVRHGSNEQSNNDTKKDMRDDRSGDFTPWSVSKSTDIVGWYCGTGQLID